MSKTVVYPFFICVYLHLCKWKRIMGPSCPFLLLPPVCSSVCPCFVPFNYCLNQIWGDEFIGPAQEQDSAVVAFQIELDEFPSSSSIPLCFTIPFPSSIGLPRKLRQPASRLIYIPSSQPLDDNEK